MPSTWAAVAAGVFLLTATSGAADKRVITDSAGRRVEVPARIERAYAAGGPATVLLYAVPQLPFPWVDFPPSVNRLIGLKWMGRVLYPEQFPDDLRAETRAFYALFFAQRQAARRQDDRSGRAGRVRSDPRHRTPGHPQLAADT